ncbi:Rieske (2Fe-2S) protein [Mucilaginibacter xinganensis]|uniref:Rieske domain-containing protein n=1 Tax=Mucilaginibacter xinganensis TaxID=1234841 RepID=A0A223NYP8_9SPHI|nr:Rieske 2Fe-2S domain-containing protein [Mucilaginibacter xinganensis]ASU34824.1 hypothetical protein MuYL_2937 [Mucilaginibacter xinganensis]
MKWYRIPVADINNPFVTKIKAGNQTICVVGYNGDIFAVSAMCPHQGFDLSKGWCENGKIICPLHGNSFDLQTGKGSGEFLKTYAVKKDGGTAYVGVRSIWEDITKLFNK